MPYPRFDPTLSVGERIAAFRTYRELSQLTCAQRVGQPLPWWQNVERGVAHVQRLSDLILIARVLGVRDLADLTGRAELGLWQDNEEHPLLPSVRAALLATYDPPAPADSPPQLGPLRQALDDAWHVYQQAPRFRAELGRELPPLLADAVAVAEYADDRAGAQSLLAETYVLVAHWLHATGATDLMWLTAERALTAARASGDRALVTLGSWQLCWTLNTLGRSEEALRHGTSGAAALEPHLPDGSHEELAAWGILQLQCAVAAARCSDEPLARRRWDLADETARRLPVGYAHRWHSFGVANLGAYAVAVPVELGQPDEAVRIAERLDPLTLPTRQRRARALVDVARGYVGRRDDVAAVHVLQRAEAESPDAVGGSVLVHEMVRELLHRCGNSVAAEVRDLARRVGILSPDPAQRKAPPPMEG